MGKCPNCGYKKWFGLEIRKCIVCGKEGCLKCIAPDFHLLFKLARAGGGLVEKVYACSKECTQRFQERILESIPIVERVGTNMWYVRAPGHSRGLFEEACFKASLKLAPKLVEEMTLITPPSILTEDNSPLLKDYRKRVYLAVASNLESAGRSLDAAKVYESLKMYDKARKIREREKQVIVRRTDVSIDLNALLKQIKDGGIIVVYRCPYCSAPLKISKDTNVESLRVCEHCGSEIEAVDIAEFLRTALS